MAADGSHPVLRRMARISAPPTGPEPPVTPARVLRRAAVRAGEALDLALTVAAIGDERCTLDDVLAGLDEAELLISLDRDGAGRGLAVIDLDLRDALVEVQTLGRLSGRPPQEGAARRTVTAADAALGLPFLDGLLRGVAGAGPGTDLPDWVAGIAGGDRYATRRAIGATLPAGDYRAVALSLDLDAGRAGRLTLVLPPVRSAVAAPPPAHGRDWAEAFQGSVQEASAVLTAVLTRHRITLAEAEALRPGTLLPLPGVTVGSVRLEAPVGVVLATARLGQVAGLRAVRLERRAALELSTGGPGGAGGPGIVDAEAEYPLDAVDPWADTDGLMPDAMAAIPPMDTGWGADIPDDPDDAQDDSGPPGPFDAAPAEGGGVAEDELPDGGAGPIPAWPADPGGPQDGDGGDVAATASLPSAGAAVASAPAFAAGAVAELQGDGAGLHGQEEVARDGAARTDWLADEAPGSMHLGTADRIGGAAHDGANRPPPADRALAPGPEQSPLEASHPPSGARILDPTTLTPDGGAADTAVSARPRGPEGDPEPAGAGWEEMSRSRLPTSPGEAPPGVRFALAGDQARDFDAEGQDAPEAAIADGLDVRRLRIEEME